MLSAIRGYLKMEQGKRFRKMQAWEKGKTPFLSLI
jgi:hypothetical protein